MKILVDMNLSPGWTDFLNQAGFQAVHLSNVGAGDASDHELMQWAAAHDYVVLTTDLDFGAILAATQRRGPSVVQVRGENLAPQAIGDRVVSALRRADRELAGGAIVSVDLARTRLRVLPLGD